MSGLKLFLFITSCCISLLANSHNGELLDSIIEKKAKELGIVELTVIYHTQDTSYVHEINRFDKDGRKIERIIPGYDSFTRHRTKYDSLGRRVHFIIYDESDTTVIQSERKWIYADSMHYKMERYGQDGKLYETTGYEITMSDSSFSVYEKELSSTYNRTTQHLSKYTNHGDSMQISEFVTFDKEGEMDEITTYYSHIATDSLNQRYIKTEGQCNVTSDEIEELANRVDGLRIYYENKQKYIQNQLDGKYVYELNDAPYSYKVYDFNWKLIQDGFVLNKKTFIYNDKGQFTKIIGWGSPIDDHGMVETNETIIEYDENGLPTSMTSRSLIKKNQRTESFTFEYR